MKLRDIITENIDVDNDQKNVFSDKRIPRVTFKHLLKLAKYREEKKLIISFKNLN